MCKLNDCLLSYLLKANNFNLQEQGKVGKESRTDRERNENQEAPDEQDHHKEDSDETDEGKLVMKCFLKNHATSTCSNAAKGIFVNLEGAKGFLTGH